MGEVIQFPLEHTWYVCRKNGRCEYPCTFCDGGLAACTVCGGTEGSLTTHCPGYECEKSHGEAIYNGYIDYINGRWRMLKGIKNESTAVKATGDNTHEGDR